MTILFHFDCICLPVLAVLFALYWNTCADVAHPLLMAGKSTMPAFFDGKYARASPARPAYKCVIVTPNTNFSFRSISKWACALFFLRKKQTTFYVNQLQCDLQTVRFYNAHNSWKVVQYFAKKLITSTGRAFTAGHTWLHAWNLFNMYVCDFLFNILCCCFWTVVLRHIQAPIEAFEGNSNRTWALYVKSLFTDV